MEVSAEVVGVEASAEVVGVEEVAEASAEVAVGEGFKNLKSCFGRDAACSELYKKIKLTQNLYFYFTKLLHAESLQMLCYLSRDTNQSLCS